MSRMALALWLLFPAAAVAQGILVPPGYDPAQGILTPPGYDLSQGILVPPGYESALAPPVPQVAAPVEQVVEAAPGALLRALDRISGITTDIELAAGETTTYRRLSITLAECRYPPEDATSKAFARLVIIDTNSAAEKFNGWMISDSPALEAMDDARYDVWLIRCKIS